MSGPHRWHLIGSHREAFTCSLHILTLFKNRVFLDRFYQQSQQIDVITAETSPNKFAQVMVKFIIMKRGKWPLSHNWIRFYFLGMLTYLDIYVSVAVHTVRINRFGHSLGKIILILNRDHLWKISMEDKKVWFYACVIYYEYRDFIYYEDRDRYNLLIFICLEGMRTLLIFYVDFLRLDGLL